MLFGLTQPATAPYFWAILFFAYLYSSIGLQWQALIMMLAVTYVQSATDLAALLFFGLAFGLFGHWINVGVKGGSG